MQTFRGFVALSFKRFLHSAKHFLIAFSRSTFTLGRLALCFINKILYNLCNTRYTVSHKALATPFWCARALMIFEN